MIPGVGAALEMKLRRAAKVHTQKNGLTYVSEPSKEAAICGVLRMCLAQDGSSMSEVHAKALSLLSAQLERWRNALAIHSPGKRKSDAEIFRAYLSRPTLRTGPSPLRK